MGLRIEVGLDCQEPEVLAEFWSQALGYEVGDLDRAGIYLDLLPPDPRLPAFYLQRVAEPKVTKNRMHLDLFVDEPDELIAALVSLGATLVGAEQTGSEGGRWQVLADPEGNEFCVCQA